MIEKKHNDEIYSRSASTFYNNKITMITLTIYNLTIQYAQLRVSGSTLGKDIAIGGDSPLGVGTEKKSAFCS